MTAEVAGSIPVSHPSYLRIRRRFTKDFPDSKRSHALSKEECEKTNRTGEAVERPYGVPSWRVSLGFVVTAISAVLLSIAVWQAFWLGREAGADVDTLTRERVAVEFQRTAFPLLADLQRYRLQEQLVTNPPHDLGLRNRLDLEVARVTRFVRAHDAQLAVLGPWSNVQTQWAKARSVKRVYSGTLLNEMEYALRIDIFYHAEDTSGLQYETNRFAQDFADMAFAKIPASINEVGQGDLLTQNALTRGTIPIPDRIRLAGRVSSMNPTGGDFDLSTDDWSLILSEIPLRGLGTSADAVRYHRDGEEFTQAGRRIAAYENANVVMRAHPAGDPNAIHSLAAAANAQIARMNDDVTTLLDRQLVRRLKEEQSRNRYVYGVVLLTALLLVGGMLLVAELSNRRNREALAKAQQESERLTAELARQHAERALRLSEAQFRAVFDGAAMGIAILDRSRTILDANSVFRNIYGDNAAGLLDGHETEFAELMRGERDLFEFEQHAMTPAGADAWTDSTVSLVSDEAGNPYFAICMFRDLTELRRSERRMMHDKTHDSLTGLPNRAQFEEQVREQFTQLKGSPESSFAILIVELDRFKDINESLGHEAGDFVLSQVGYRLRSTIEGADMVARLGGDEFAVLVRSLSEVLHVEVIARRVLAALGKPIALGSRFIFVSASIGIAVGSATYQRGEDVMRDADIAVRYAKSGGGGRLAMFDSKMHARAEKRLQLTTDLRLALERGEFELLYQPIVTIADGELVGSEALLRWKHPAEGMMVPTDFMPLAEQTGLAVHIGRFVVRTVCRQAATWKRSGAGGPLPINVNVSATELLDNDFESTLLGAVREFGIQPQDLTLEITESVVLDAGTRPNTLVERLRKAGFNICIDDFGTGYSSLRYLQQFKVDAIKIDRSFVCGPDGDVASEPIVRTLMTLAEAFGVRVVAEGIETQRQLEVLQSAGCRYGQGYYYSAAVPSEKLAALYPTAFVQSRKHASA